LLKPLEFSDLDGWEQNDSKYFLILGFFRSTVLPIMIVALFGVAFVAVSARIWLPGDMIAPAPMN